MPPGGLGAAIVLLALIPGWLHLRLRERLAPSPRATGLVELLGVLAVGLSTTGVSTVIVALVPHSWTPGLLDLDGWINGGDAYLRQHIRAAATSVGLIFVLAVAIAWLLYLPLQFRRPAEFQPHGSVWVHALGARPKGRVPWIGVQLRDGKFVEGLLHSYSLAEGSSDERDVALQDRKSVV